MTASAPKALWPGRTAPAGRPAGALWVLLLAGVLIALPCAGQAKAVAAERGAAAQAAAFTTVAGPDTAAPAAPNGSADPHVSAHPGVLPAAHPVVHTGPQRHWTWCAADSGLPSRNNGCSSHPYCAQDAQLPNPPPHPQPALAPRPVLPEALPRVAPSGLLVGPHPAPDLHELQVHRS